MKMYREPLNYGVWRGFWNDSNDFVKQGLVAYFAELEAAKAYIDHMGSSYALYDVETQKALYPKE